MTDTLSTEQRSELMSRVRVKDTKPEIFVRKLLHRNGYRFRLHSSKLPGKPDVVLPRYRTVVFVHGCFWHGHGLCDKGTRRPKTNVDFWEEKIASNMARHKRVVGELQELGWRALTVWECETRDFDTLEHKLLEALGHK